MEQDEMGGKAAGAGMEVLGLGKGWDENRDIKNPGVIQTRAGFGMRLPLPQNFLGSMSRRQAGFGESGETSGAVAGEGRGEQGREFFLEFPL